MAVTTTKFSMRGARSTTATAAALKKSQQKPSDDDILGLVTAVSRPITPVDGGDADHSVTAGKASSQSANQLGQAPSEFTGDPANASGVEQDANATVAISPELAKIIDANPQVRQVFDEAQAYHEVFASPDAARDAKSQLDELDGMFFSAQPGDHAALAARLHDLSPQAFQNFARAVQAHAAKVSAHETPVTGASTASAQSSPAAASRSDVTANDQGSDAVDSIAPPVKTGIHPPAASSTGAISPSGLHSPVAQTPAAPAPDASANAARRATQVAFFHDTNAAAVEQILGAIHSQVDRLLPESIPSSARNRIVGEVYREIDATLRANRQLGKQLRDAFHAGAGDAAHQRAIVTLVTGRAKQALPSVAKRVIGEWTHGVVAANHEKLSRYQAASKRVDIAGGGASDGVNRKPISARDLNYRKLSDADILNL